VCFLVCCFVVCLIDCLIVCLIDASLYWVVGVGGLGREGWREREKRLNFY